MTEFPPGFTIIDNVITEEEEKELINFLDNESKEKWKFTSGKNMLHYGYTYSHRATSLSNLRSTFSIPDILFKLYEKCVAKGLTLQDGKQPQQILINKYKGDQIMNHHIDNPVLFGDKIIVVSLQSDSKLEFKLNKQSLYLKLNRRSAYLMEDDARYKWTHGISAKKIIDDKNKRYSIVMRTIIN